MSVRQPCMKRKDRNLDRERESKGSEQQHPGLRRQDKSTGFHRTQNGDEIERSPKTRLIRVNVVKCDDRNEHQQTADCRKDKEFDRRIDAILTAPDADQEEHRNQRGFEKQVKYEQ